MPAKLAIAGERALPQEIVAERLALNFVITSIGSTTLPSDLLIFSTTPESSFLMYTKPWPNTFSALGSSAANSIAGQRAQWKRVMSLPMKWMSAGHYFSNRRLIVAVADAGDVGQQGVEPDLDREVRVERHPDAPFLIVAGDVDVLQARSCTRRGSRCAGFRAE